MSAIAIKLGDRHRTFPKSVQPGIPKLGELKAGWNRVKIGDLFQVVNRPCKLSDIENYRLVTVKRSRGGIESRGDLKGSEIAVKSQFYIDTDDFLISKRQIVHGACAIVPAEFAGSIVSNEYAVLRCKPALHLGFLQQLIHSIYFQQTCFHSSLGVHVEKMIFSTPEWFKWKIDIPEIDEQQKIADFLGAVDERIKLLRRRRDAVQRYKQGIMQRLFAQSTRFKREGGSAYPDWKIARLGRLGEFSGGGTPDTSVEEYWAGNIPWVSSSDIFEKSIHRVNLVKNITQSALKASATKTIPAGSILIVTRVGVGKVAISPVELCTSQDFSNFTPHSDNVRYLAYWLSFNKNKLLSLSQGTSIKGLTTVDLKGLKIELPHVDEQEKIADLLSAIDDKIAAVSAQVDQTQAFKRGLLQQMFV